MSRFFFIYFTIIRAMNILCYTEDFAIIIIAKISVTSPIVINMPTTELLADDTIQRILLFNVLSV